MQPVPLSLESLSPLVVRDGNVRIDMNSGKIVVEGANGEVHTLAMDSPEAFQVLSQVWLRCGWDNKHVYSFTWHGRPIIQLPEDMIRMQEVLYTVQPDVIVETGIAHGGSLIFYAGLCKMWDKGRVIGIDIEIRPHNRKAIEEHPLYQYITLIEGDSSAPDTVQKVQDLIKPGEKVLVILDSCHTKAHVLAELEAYAPLVSPGSYIVATDGIMGQLGNAPRTQEDWDWNNPAEASRKFAATHPNFVIEQPAYLFNEGTITRNVTYWPDSWLLRKD
jgi:cephalosporin hydroxylase